MQGGGVLTSSEPTQGLQPPGPLFCPPAFPGPVPTFVGEHNPYGQDSRYALFCWPVGSAGWRLAHIVLGLRRRSYLSCPRLNLLTTERWSVPAARVAATSILAAPPTDVLVLLGRKVAAAFDVADVSVFGSKRLIGGPLVVVLPHPSGRCLAWNEPDAVSRARAAVGAACPGLPLGEDDPSPKTIDGEAA